MKRSDLYTLEFKLSQLEKDARDIAAMVGNTAPIHGGRFMSMAEYAAQFATQVRITEDVPKDKPSLTIASQTNQERLPP